MFMLKFNTGHNATSNLQATATADSLTVTWDAPPEGRVTGYTVELLDLNATIQTINPDVRMATVFGLDAGTRYTVVVITIDDDQEDYPLENSFYTSK